jgi:hypothetical protein
MTIQEIRAKLRSYDEELVKYNLPDASGKALSLKDKYPLNCATNELLCHPNAIEIIRKLLAEIDELDLEIKHFYKEALDVVNSMPPLPVPADIDNETQVKEYIQALATHTGLMTRLTASVLKYWRKRSSKKPPI